MAGRTILIVDDDAALVEVLRRRLEANGYQVVAAADGAEGLERAKAAAPDLIISDVIMPTMNGYAFVKALRAIPSLARTPVIILTGKEKMQDLFYFEGVELLDYIVKPFEAPEMVQKVAQLLARVQRHLGEGPGDGLRGA